MITCKSADEAIWRATRDIMKRGYEIAPRGTVTRELTSYTFSLTDPRNRVCTLRPLRLGYCAAKVAWDVAERDDVGGIVMFNENGRKFSDDGERIQGENYGQRFSKYLDEALELLRYDRDSRRAWVPVWQPEDLINVAAWDGPNAMWNHHLKGYPSRESNNVPCALGFELRIIDDALVMQAIFRSNAVIGVLPYDIFLMTTLQELIANELDIELGAYEHTMLSAHVYERELVSADELVKAGVRTVHPMQRITRTLSEARVSYPLALEAATAGRAFDANGDPIIAMLMDAAQAFRAEKEKATHA